MPSKDSFHVGKKLLSESNYSLLLGEDTYVGAYNQRILIGPVDFEDGEARFSKKSIVIPSSCYFDFVNCVSKAYHCFQANELQHWEVLLFKHSKVHHVMAKFETWDSDEPWLKINVKWNY